MGEEGRVGLGIGIRCISFISDMSKSFRIKEYYGGLEQGSHPLSPPSHLALNSI